MYNCVMCGIVASWNKKNYENEHWSFQNTSQDYFINLYIDYIPVVVV